MDGIVQTPSLWGPTIGAQPHFRDFSDEYPIKASPRSALLTASSLKRSNKKRKKVMYICKMKLGKNIIRKW